MKEFGFAALLQPFVGLIILGATIGNSGDAFAADETPVTGKEVPQLAAFDEMMKQVLAENRVPGGSLAVARDGKIVYARGFGYANRDTEDPVEPSSLFRIASISKPITATAILMLVEQDKLKLDQPVFELLGIDAFIPEGKEADPRIKDITILHCLQHTAGWDREKSYDPMFEPFKIAEAMGIDCPPSTRDTIAYIQGQPLDFTPGERFAYANIDYCILGRVIEKISGQPYEVFVRENIFEPLGMLSMRIGHTLPELRAAGEVTYYAGRKREPAVFKELKDQQVPLQYGAFHLEAMDAHGGWIGTASDLARFASSFDDIKHSPLLQEETISTMLTRPEGAAGCDGEGKPAPKYYGCGWSVRTGEWGGGSLTHSGALEGTATLLIHRNDRVSIAVLFNKRYSRDRKELSAPVLPRLHEAADKITEWPQ